MNAPLPSPQPPWPRELAGGLITGAVAVVYAMSFAALLFPGNLRALLPYGVGLCLVNAMLGAFWLAWRSQLPFAIAGPDGNTTSILAAMAATLAVSSAATRPALDHALLLLVCTTLLCALLFLALGMSRLGSAVRYIPFPVIGGFLASTGWLIVVGALHVVIDRPAAWGAPGQLEAMLRDPRFIATVALGVGYMAIFRRWRRPALVPMVLLGSGVLVVALLAAGGVAPQQARAAGWMFDASSPPHWIGPWQLLQGAGGFDWRWLASQWTGMVSVAAIALITVLLGASGLEVISRRDISLDEELRTHGWLNLLAAGLGGYLSLISVSRSVVLLETGARTRAAGMVAAAVCALAAGGATLALGWVPRVVLGGFLFYLGLSIVWEWVVESRARLSRADWLLIVVILVTTATIGFTVAMLAGVIASCLNFALSYSRAGVVQHDLDSSGLHSTVMRPAAHRALLARHAGDIRVLVLRGVIFFGTAHSLLERVRDFIAQPAVPAGGRVLVLDFSNVASVDSSAAMTFSKIVNILSDRNGRAIFSGMNAQVAAALGGRLTACPSLDQAMDAAEECLLTAHGLDPRGMAEPLDDWLPRELDGAQHWPALRSLLVRRQVALGDVLVRQGDAACDLYLIESGRLAITLDGQASGQRLAGLMSGNIVGEMALYARIPRSATVTAEADSVVWALDRDALEQLHASAPATALALHAFIMRTMADRVQRANATIAALQRGA